MNEKGEKNGVPRGENEWQTKEDASEVTSRWGQHGEGEGGSGEGKEEEKRVRAAAMGEKTRKWVGVVAFIRFQMHTAPQGWKVSTAKLATVVPKRSLWAVQRLWLTSTVALHMLGNSQLPGSTAALAPQCHG